MSDCRQLVIVLGDQLDAQAAALDDFDTQNDCIWMAEVAQESTHVWSSKPRIAVFLAAMRQFAKHLRQRGLPLDYTTLEMAENTGTLAGELQRAIAKHQPQRLVMTAPGDWRVLQAIKTVAEHAQLPLEIRDDRHFFTTVRDFRAHAKGRKQLRMEYFYREQRRRFGVLMDGDTPVGGKWNFDSENRTSFGREGPPPIPSPAQFAPDACTKEVLELVNTRFATHPGSLDSFAWPLTREQALQALDAFIRQRLPQFGRWQDAMWQGEVWLWHSHLSCAMNLKLLSAAEVVAAAEAAWRNGDVPLAAAEGFIRQILGWREYVRGIYWTQMPDYAHANALQAQLPLPTFYWDGQTDMACLRDAISQTLKHGYAHHIQRLMVTGLYALLLGVRPQAVHEWYLAVYVDAVEWVELPNTLGMSQYADGGLMASKPYAASGRYIQRMSNYCSGCRYDRAQATGIKACPFTTLYWDFLLRHRDDLSKNPRMAMPLKHLQRFDDEKIAAIQQAAKVHREGVLAQGDGDES